MTYGNQIFTVRVTVRKIVYRAIKLMHAHMVPDPGDENTPADAKAISLDHFIGEMVESKTIELLESRFGVKLCDAIEGKPLTAKSCKTTSVQ